MNILSQGVIAEDPQKFLGKTVVGGQEWFSGTIYYKGIYERNGTFYSDYGVESWGGKVRIRRDKKIGPLLGWKFSEFDVVNYEI